MKIVELLNEAKFDYSLADYQKVPYDSGFEDFEDVMTKQQDTFEPHRGPQEGKMLGLMLRGIKPAALVDNAKERQLFEPYIKDGTFKVAAQGRLGTVVTLPGEEWRGPRLLKLFDILRNNDDPDPSVENKIHAKIGMLLGIPKESIRYFIGHLGLDTDSSL